MERGYERGLGLEGKEEERRMPCLYSERILDAKSAIEIYEELLIFYSKEKEKESGEEIGTKKRKIDEGKSETEIGIEMDAKTIVETGCKNVNDLNDIKQENSGEKEEKIKTYNILCAEFLNLYKQENILYAENFLQLLPQLSKLTLKLILDAGSAILLPHHIR
jgi:hypothetical protein